MDNAIQLQRQLADYTASLYNEGILDEQFIQLQELQDESNPDFVIEVVSLFFQDSHTILNHLTTALSEANVEFKKVDAHVHQLKGSSSSIGAHRVQKVCVGFRKYCEERNVEGCLNSLQQVTNECTLLNNKLHTFFKLEKQVVAAGGPFPLS